MNNDNNIIKYKNLDIDKFNIYDNNIKYDNNNFSIQSPIISNYNIINQQGYKYIELSIDETKPNNIIFLNLIKSIETKISNELNDTVKTQLSIDLYNTKHLKVKMFPDTLLFDKNSNEIKILSAYNISLLLKLDYNNKYYSWNVIQILEY